MSFKKVLLALFPILIFSSGVLLSVRYYNKQMDQKIDPTPIENVPQTKPKVIGWIPYWDQKTAFESFSKNIKLFDFVSVFWYRVNANGNLTTYKQTIEDQSIIDLAHQNKVKILAVVANMPDYEEGGDWDPRRVNQILSTPKARSKHISDLLTLIEKNNLDGIDIDYEALRSSQKENFSLLIEELADKLHEKGKILGVAIHPKTSENNPAENNGSHAQDLARIAKAADHMYLMTYTQHAISSPPGPAGSIDWIEKIIGYAVNDVGVPKEKIFLGIGLFGLEWHQTNNGSFYGDNDDLTFRQIKSIIENYSAKIRWDQKAKSAHFDYLKMGERHIVWYENSESVVERLKLAKNFNLGGIAFWRLGDEDPVVWDRVGNR